MHPGPVLFTHSEEFLVVLVQSVCLAERRERSADAGCREEEEEQEQRSDPVFTAVENGSQQPRPAAAQPLSNGRN